MKVPFPVWFTSKNPLNRKTTFFSPVSTPPKIRNRSCSLQKRIIRYATIIKYYMRHNARSTIYDKPKCPTRFFSPCADNVLFRCSSPIRGPSSCEVGSNKKIERALFLERKHRRRERRPQGSPGKVAVTPHRNNNPKNVGPTFPFHFPHNTNLLDTSHRHPAKKKHNSPFYPFHKRWGQIKLILSGLFTWRKWYFQLSHAYKHIFSTHLIFL